MQTCGARRSQADSVAVGVELTVLCPRMTLFLAYYRSNRRGDALKTAPKNPILVKGVLRKALEELYRGREA